MKTLFLFLLTSSGLAACQKAAGLDTVEVGPGQLFTLATQQTATVATDDSGRAQLTLATVNDSRCPTNAFCIWAGSVEVTVALTDAATTQTVRLGLKPSAQVGDSLAVTLNQRPYWLRLLAVTPYPTGATPSQTPQATLRLRPR